MRIVQGGAPLHDHDSGGARAAVLWVCRLGVAGDEVGVHELEGLTKRLANGGVVAEGGLRLQRLMQVVLAVLRAELAAVAVVAADEPLAAAEREGDDSVLLVAPIPLELVGAHARLADRRLLALLRSKAAPCEARLVRAREAGRRAALPGGYTCSVLYMQVRVLC